MKFNRNQAKALTNTKELELYDLARPPKLNKLSVNELRNLVKRSRTLRDKLRDVKRTQVRSKQAKTKTRGPQPADRSREKAELFAEVHDVFVARLEKVEAGEAKAKAKPAANKPTKTDKNIETRADRTSVKQKLKKVKKLANAPAPTPAGKTGKAATKKTSNNKRSDDGKAKKASNPIKLLASAALSKTGAKPKTRAASRSAKATFASKAATTADIDTIQSPQEASRKPDPVRKVEQTRIARSGVKKKLSHVSAVNKRKQGRRDAK
jgi:hypothetical protein